MYFSHDATSVLTVSVEEKTKNVTLTDAAAVTYKGIYNKKISFKLPVMPYQRFKLSID